MIKSFRDKETKNIFNGEISKKFPQDIQSRARRKIDSLYLAGDISGDRLGQFSIRVNDRYRVCFEWLNGFAENVELTDYH